MALVFAVVHLYNFLIFLSIPFFFSFLLLLKSVIDELGRSFFVLFLTRAISKGLALRNFVLKVGVYLCLD